MAITTSIVGRDTLGSRAARFVEVTLDALYVSGGWAVTPKQLGLGTNGKIHGVIVLNPILGGYTVVWDSSTQKLNVYETTVAGGVQVELTTATAMDTLVVELVAVGYGQG